MKTRLLHIRGPYYTGSWRPTWAVQREAAYSTDEISYTLYYWYGPSLHRKCTYTRLDYALAATFKAVRRFVYKHKDAPWT